MAVTLEPLQSEFSETTTRKHPSNSEEITTRLNSNKPKLQLPGDDRLLSAFAAELADVVKTHGIYHRGGLAFIVNPQQNGLEVISPQMLRTLIEDHVVCYRIRRWRGTEVAFERTMSESDAKGVLSSQQFLNKLPNLQRVATARLPVMRKDGTIALLPQGYDPESLTLTMSQCDYNEAMSLPEAKKVINDLLGEFPFADVGRSKAVAVAAMASLYVFVLLPSGSVRPIFIYLANAEGAGKTMLAKCAISPAHGLVKTDGDLKDKTETSKELLTAVIEGRQYILFDNCKKHLDSPYLEAFATSVMWSGRILGVSRSFCGENNVTIFVTGNGCTVSPDLRRRSLFIELFMKEERAEDRKFQRTLDDGILLALRPDILAALWALVREWDAAGRPRPGREHSSFPRWADIVGGIVECAGYGCPLESAEIQTAADTDGADMRELAKLLDPTPTKFDEIVGIAREHGLFERIIGNEGDLKPSDKSAFGKLLKRYDRRVFCGSKRFVVDGKGHSRRFYAVDEAQATHSQHGEHDV